MEAKQEQNGGEDEQVYAEDEEDDEIDFNLGGNGSGGYEASTSHHESGGPGIKEDG